MTKDYAREQLARIVRDSYPVVYSVIFPSPSGMSARVRSYMIDREDGHHCWITGYLSALTGRPVHRTGNTIVLKGCGFNRAHAVAEIVTDAIGPERPALKGESL